MRLYKQTQDITAPDMKAFLEKSIVTRISNLRFVFQYNIEYHDILAGRTVIALLFHVFVCSSVLCCSSPPNQPWTKIKTQDQQWTRSSYSIKSILNASLIICRTRLIFHAVLHHMTRLLCHVKQIQRLTHAIHFFS